MICFKITLVSPGWSDLCHVFGKKIIVLVAIYVSSEIFIIGKLHNEYVKLQ